MQKTFAVVFIALVLLGLSSSTEGDLRLDRKRSVQVSKIDGEVVYERNFDDVIFLGKGVVRHDMEEESFIVRADENVFMWLDHSSKTYSENPLPLRLEDLLTEAEKRCLEHFPERVLEMNAEASVERTDEQRQIGRWSTSKLRIEGKLGNEMQFVGTHWITRDLEIDLEPYRLLVGGRAALSPRMRAWIGQLISEGGVPVETKTTWTLPLRRREFSLELTDVREVETDEMRYRLPNDYARVARPRLDIQCAGAESRP